TRRRSRVVEVLHWPLVAAAEQLDVQSDMRIADPKAVVGPLPAPGVIRRRAAGGQADAHEPGGDLRTEGNPHRKLGAGQRVRRGDPQGRVDSPVRFQLGVSEPRSWTHLSI